MVVLFLGHDTELVACLAYRTLNDTLMKMIQN